MLDLFKAYESDVLSVVEIGQLMGDPELPSRTPGAQAQRLIDAEAAGQLQFAGVKGGNPLVTRNALAKWLATYALPYEGQSRATSWAHRKARVGPLQGR